MTQSIYQEGIKGLVGRLLASAGFESRPGFAKNLRVDAYGDLFTLPGLTPLQAAALGGGYFLGANPTPGTEIATTTSQTAYDQDKPVAIFQNNGPRVVIPDFLSLKIEQVPTSATRWLYTLVTYQGTALAGDYVSGGSELTMRNAYPASNQSALGKVYFGAITSQDVAKTIIANGCVKDVIPVIDDQVIFRWGHSPVAGILYAGAGERVISLPPVVLGQYEAMALYLYGDSNGAAPTYEVQSGHIER